MSSAKAHETEPQDAMFTVGALAAGTAGVAFLASRIKPVLADVGWVLAGTSLVVLAIGYVYCALRSRKVNPGGWIAPTVLAFTSLTGGLLHGWPWS